MSVDLKCNANIDLEAKGNASNLVRQGGSETIPLANVKIHEDTLGSAVSLTTSYADIGGLTDVVAGESIPTFKLWLTVPDPQVAGTYVYKLYVKATEH